VSNSNPGLILNQVPTAEEWNSYFAMKVDAAGGELENYATLPFQPVPLQQVEELVFNVSGGVTSWNTRTGAVTMTLEDVTGVGGAPIDSPVFTGLPITVEPAASDDSFMIATTHFVQQQVFSAGSGPTPSTQPPLMDGPTAIVGTSAAYARGDHVHPINTSELIDGGSF
jgi:hypothetical protein